jgi:hypothetical protein
VSWVGGFMEFGFVYRVTLRDRTNPPNRHQECSDLIRHWFKSNGIHYGMGALGGMRVIYGTIDGRSQQELAQLRAQFAEWLARLQVCATVCLGRTKSTESVNLMEDDWELTFDVDNLTEQDRYAAHAYYAELAQWAEKHAKKPAADE